MKPSFTDVSIHAFLPWKNGTVIMPPLFPVFSVSLVRCSHHPRNTSKAQEYSSSSKNRLMSEELDSSPAPKKKHVKKNFKIILAQILSVIILYLKVDTQNCLPLLPLLCHLCCDVDPCQVWWWLFSAIRVVDETRFTSLNAAYHQIFCYNNPE